MDIREVGRIPPRSAQVRLSSSALLPDRGRWCPERVSSPGAQALDALGSILTPGVRIGRWASDTAGAGRRGITPAVSSRRAQGGGV